MIPVLIGGAGPTGLALALWLTRVGVAVRIIDKNSGPADYSRALGVQARTLELYQMLGIAQHVIEGGVHVRGANLWVAGKHVANIPLADIGHGMTPFPFVIDYAQDQHERMLIAQLELLGVHVERETELVSFEQKDNGVYAMVRRRGLTEEHVDAAYVAGCDGAHSRVRDILGIDFPGGTYEQLFYVADVEADVPTPNDEIHIDLATADLLALFPMKGEGHVRLVGTVVGRDAEGMTFENAAQGPITQMKLNVRRVNWFSPYRVHHRVASRFRDRRAFLLGDAAHIHSPVGAQGMNTGIGDAFNLAWKIAAVVKGEMPSRVLDTYEPERIAFARRLVATTDKAFTFAMRRGRIAQFVRTRIFPQAIAQFIRRRFSRRFAFRTISQLGLNYRRSELSEGGSGELRAGDRLPWEVFAGGTDNFDALRSLSWQIHAYGDANAESAADETGLPLHAFEFGDAAAAAGIAEDAVYVIRPDGYVGYAGNAAGVAAYWKRLTAR